MGRETFRVMWMSVLEEALIGKASDIHLGPESEAPYPFNLSFRIQGILVWQKTYPQRLGLILIDQLKSLCQLDIAERSLPQDGSLSLPLADFRVNTLPCLGGEKAVLRVLRRSGRPRLQELGLPVEAMQAIEQCLALSSGLIAIAGATGSGKTTTLHALLGELDSKSLNIVTLENPVEYRAPGLSQVQITSELTFARGLRALLRQDPDVIFVGECRDSETAHLALEAAGTGHLVLTSIHAGGLDQIASRFEELSCSRANLEKVLRFCAFQELIPSPKGLNLAFQWKSYL